MHKSQSGSDTKHSYPHYLMIIIKDCNSVMSFQATRGLVGMGFGSRATNTFGSPGGSMYRDATTAILESRPLDEVPTTINAPIPPAPVFVEAPINEEPGFDFGNEDYFLNRNFDHVFRMTGQQILGNPDAVMIYTLPASKHYIFQKHDPNFPGDMTKRAGPIDRCIFKEVRFQGDSNLPFDVRVHLEDGTSTGVIRGNTYSSTGARAPYILTADEIMQRPAVIHRADVSTAPLIRDFGHLTESSLRAKVMPSTREEHVGFSFVPTNSEIVDLCRRRGVSGVGFQMDQYLTEHPEAQNALQGYVMLPNHVIDDNVNLIGAVLKSIQPFNLGALRVRLVPDLPEGTTLKDLVESEMGSLDVFKKSHFKVTARLGFSYNILEPAQQTK